ncbi:hypothetical protein ACN9ML_29515 [Dyadobacter endophyticus]|uniref:hypothetical protein n=1 Tax=Dyadobacter endophyticus TaxID=1749036 RepID=UPI003CEC6519
MASASQPGSSPQLTMRRLAESLRPDWSFRNDWLCWPPDTFALISIILERTGCYRHCLMNYRWFRVPEYSSLIRYAGQHWLNKTADLVNGAAADKFGEKYFFTLLDEDRITSFSKNPKLYESSVRKFEEVVTTIEKYWDDEEDNVIDLEILRAINDSSEPVNAGSTFFSSYRKFTEALLQLMSMADSLCAGMGLLEKVNSGPNCPTQIVHCLGNLLLTASGSLSSLPKFHGAVLPKMRTPQGGITTRSLSHHLTFHTSEVEVMWRTIPWYSHHQMSLNVIAIPFPFEITENNFEARSERFQSVQYFSYKSTLAGRETEADEELDRIVELVWKESEKLDQVHILVFPESSLSEKQYSRLKRLFYERLLSNCGQGGRLYHLPLIVAGVSKESGGASFDGERDQPSHNEVRMSTFFAGKWYDVVQRKHHRWHLNKNQLVQYWLAGKLPSERRWFEHISVAQRRLTILAPTGWLALTTLICEDLAQQDPVSPIIRGIGPTFLMALLSDGPQLNNRWSARYANVLADDPGTAVLSLTSLGMVKRSRPLVSNLYIGNRLDPQAGATIALWKDMFRGQQEINLTDGNRAVRFTISAKYKEEYTLDGRSDGGNAAVFELEGYEQLELPKKPDDNTQKKDMPNNSTANTINEEIHDKAPLEGTWLDIRELTAVHFTLDSLIELRGKNYKQICNWLKASDRENIKYPRAIDIVITQMKRSLVKPRNHGIDATFSAKNEKWPSDDITTIGDDLSKVFKSVVDKSSLPGPKRNDVDYYKELYTRANKMYEAAKFEYFRPNGDEKIHLVNEGHRKYFLVPLAIMHALRAKISVWQLHSVGIADDDDITTIIKLRKEIKNVIIELQAINFTNS